MDHSNAKAVSLSSLTSTKTQGLCLFLYIYIYMYIYIYIYMCVYTVEQTPVKQMAERLHKTMVKQNVAFVCCDRAVFPCVTSVCLHPCYAYVHKNTDKTNVRGTTVTAERPQKEVHLPSSLGQWPSSSHEAN